MFPIELLGVETYPAISARNLGVIFNKNFNLRSHISAICSSCIYHIRNLRRIRHHLDLDSANVFVNALVSSRLDYCNSFLSWIAETDLTKLQRDLNRLARVVTKSPPFTRSVPLLRSLHWLPVKYRVHFKLCLLIYRALHEEQPVYLRSLIATSLASCSLRSNRGITLFVPRIRTNTGARAFTSCAPSLWNNPNNLLQPQHWGEKANKAGTACSTHHALAVHLHVAVWPVYDNAGFCHFQLNLAFFPSLWNNLPLSVRSATSAAAFTRRLKTYLFDLASPPPP